MQTKSRGIELFAILTHFYGRAVIFLFFLPISTQEKIFVNSLFIYHIAVYQGERIFFIAPIYGQTENWQLSEMYVRRQSYYKILPSRMEFHDKNTTTVMR